jgi:hypothetical protein
VIQVVCLRYLLIVPFFSECKSEGEQLIAIREAMKLLPTAHYTSLKFIIEHLSK